MQWLIDPWTTPRLQMTVLQELIQGVKVLIVFGIILLIANTIVRRL